MTAIENILVGEHPRLKTSWPAAVFRTSRYKQEEQEAEEEARRLLRYVGLGGMGDLLARNLPYGAQRRVELARALATQPKILFLDEPTAGMNPEELVQMMEIIRHVHDELF